MRYYLYTDIPGAGKDWTLAVLATSKADAADYMRVMYLGGRYRYLGEVDNPENMAHCGAVAYGAQRRLEVQP